MLPVMNFDVRKLSPVLGAEIRGVDLSSEIDSATFEAIHQSFLDHGVLVFKDQPALASQQQVGFAQRFGPLHTHPAAPSDDPDGAVFVIHAHKDSPIANGNGWHSDVSCDETPPMATMLQIQQLPVGGGGDTLFANTEAAYATLDQPRRQRLRGLLARHESEHVYRGRYADRGVSDRYKGYPFAVHLTATLPQDPSNDSAPTGT